MAELIRRRGQREVVPPTTDASERRQLLILNVMESISRDIRRTGLVTTEHVRLVEALYTLADGIGGGAK